MNSNCNQLTNGSLSLKDKVENERERARRARNEGQFQETRSRSRSRPITPQRQEIAIEQLEDINFKFAKGCMIHNGINCVFHDIYQTMNIWMYGALDEGSLKQQIQQECKAKNRNNYYYLKLLANNLKFRLIIINGKKIYRYGNKRHEAVYLTQKGHYYAIRIDERSYYVRMEFNQRRKNNQSQTWKQPLNYGQSGSQGNQQQSNLILMQSNMEQLSVDDLFKLRAAIDNKLQAVPRSSFNQSIPTSAQNVQQEQQFPSPHFNQKNIEFEIPNNKPVEETNNVNIKPKKISKVLKGKQQMMVSQQSAIFNPKEQFADKIPNREEPNIQQFAINEPENKYEPKSSKNKSIEDFFKSVSVVKQSSPTQNSNQKQQGQTAGQKTSVSTTSAQKKYTCECGVNYDKQTCYQTHIYKYHNGKTPDKNKYSKNGVLKGSCDLQQPTNQF